MCCAHCLNRGPWLDWAASSTASVLPRPAVARRPTCRKGRPESCREQAASSSGCHNPGDGFAHSRPSLCPESAVSGSLGRADHHLHVRHRRATGHATSPGRVHPRLHWLAPCRARYGHGVSFRFTPPRASADSIHDQARLEEGTKAVMQLMRLSDFDSCVAQTAAPMSAPGDVEAHGWRQEPVDHGLDRDAARHGSASEGSVVLR